MQDNQEIDRYHDNALQSVEMLRAVIGGETYEAVAVRFGVSRTAVERRIKSVAVQLTQVVGVDGLKEEGAAFVRRLRLISPPDPTAHGATRTTSRTRAAQLAELPARSWPRRGGTQSWRSRRVGRGSASGAAWKARRCSSGATPTRTQLSNST